MEDEATAKDAGLSYEGTQRHARWSEEVISRTMERPADKAMKLLESLPIETQERIVECLSDLAQDWEDEGR